MRAMPTWHNILGLALAASLVACAGPAATTAPPAATTAPPSGTTAPPAGTTAPAGTTSAPATATATAGQSGTLTVLEWSGYEDPLYFAEFAEAYPNVELNFPFGTSDADIYGKIKAGDQSDLFHAYTGWLQFYVDEGLADPIDTSRLSNWDKVPDSFKAVGQFNGQQYFVPFDWGFTSILYRTDHVASVDSWSILMDETYDDHISMWDDGPGAVTVSSYIHGYDETAITDQQLEAIKQEWIAQKPLNFAYWASDQAELVPWIRDDDVWVAYAWQGAYAVLLGEGLPVAYADPEEGRNSWVGVYGLRKGTTNLDLAYAFLDSKLGNTTGENLVNNFYYGTANNEVMAAITDETLKEAFSVDDPTVLERTNFTPNLTAQQRDDWTTMWAEVKASP